MIITATERLYSPLFCHFLERDENGRGDKSIPITQQTAVYHEENIRATVLWELLPETAERGLMTYYRFDGGTNDSTDEKVTSLFVDVEAVEGKLWAVATLQLTEPLTPDELVDIKDFLAMQYNIGFGEGLRQREIETDFGGLYVNLWSSGNGFFIDTQLEFEGRLGSRISPDITIQPALLPSDPTGSGYLIASTDDSDYYIPNALHIQRDDSLAVYPDDESVAEAAEADGIKLIYGMPDVPDGVYLDTPENRAVITDYNNTRDELLAQIAKKHCRVETLETRKSDSLDFHEVSVWGLKSALEEAYNTGIAHQRAKTNDVDRADAPDYEKLERQLRDRLAENYNVYKRDMLNTSKENLFYSAAEILPVQEAYAYFTHEHAFTESDVDFLLKFENPLELISDRWSDGPVETTGRIDAIFSDMERTLQNGGYTLMTDEPAAAPELPGKADVGGDGEKPSVLDRIKQHAKDARDRPPAPKDKTDRRKTEPEH